MLAEKTLQVAISQIGVEENPKGSNSGPQVDQYLRSVSLGPGFAWCMAFVYWCVNEACKQLEIVNPIMKTGGVLYQYRHTKCRTIPAKSWQAVKPGDIFIMVFKNGNGHTGIVKKIENGIVYTVEGNTNDEGSREGYEVCERERALTSIAGFIQLP
jgi:hypothetical protein